MLHRKPIVISAALLIAVCAYATAAPLPLVPNDPLYSHQPYLTNIGLEQAWGTTLGSPSVTVAMLDTGVITTTPDLAGRLLPQSSTTGTAPFSDSYLTDPANPTILHHGTWTSSTIAMGVNNGVGGAGIGNFSVLPITVTDSAAHNASFWIAQGIRQAADQGARVISISQSTLDYQQLDTAAAYARTKGALTFIAGGNVNARIDLGPLPDLIVVAGTDLTDHRWVNASNGDGSTWGPQVDLAAPADTILVADPTVLHGYGTISGTSFSAPIAAGVAALAWSVNPNLTPDQVQSMLYDTAVHLGDPGKNEMFGWGRINAAGVVAAALATVPEPSTLVMAGLGLGGLAVAAVRRRRAA